MGLAFVAAAGALALVASVFNTFRAIGSEPELPLLERMAQRRGSGQQDLRAPQRDDRLGDEDGRDEQPVDHTLR